MLKRMKLAPKLALAIGSALTVILVILITITALMSKKAVEESTHGELNAISKANSLQIQEIFEAANSVAENMQSYMEQAYQTAEEDPSQMEIPIEPEARAMCESDIYDKILSSLNYDVEVFLRENARNSAVHNEDIMGIGVMFEPYKFQDDMRDYAFYVDENSAGQTVEPYGVYSEYSQEVFYKEAVEARMPLVTDPYEYNGMTIVSYARPIIYDDDLKGVAVADVDINKFRKVDATNKSYPSMYATIL